MSSPAFVLYGPRPGEPESTDKKSKRGKDEWGISPEYEGLIGDLSAKEGDAEKISTKLNKKKPTAPPATPKPPKPTPAPAPAPSSQPQQRESLTTSPAPPPTQTEDKSKLEELVKNMQGKGVDMGALLQEALAKMKGIPLKSPQPQQPPAKRVKHTFPTQTKAPVSPAFPPSGVISQTKATNKVVQPPIHMPMPLPYTAAKMAPIPMAGAANPVKIESGMVSAPVPQLGMGVQNPLLSSISPPVQTTFPSASLSKVESAPTVGGDSTVSPEPSTNGISAPANPEPEPPEPPEPQIQQEVKDVVTEMKEVKLESVKPLETAASKRSPRGKKRALVNSHDE
jgi:hypothetical protein